MEYGIFTNGLKSHRLANVFLFALRIHIHSMVKVTSNYGYRYNPDDASDRQIVASVSVGNGNSQLNT